MLVALMNSSKRSLVKHLCEKTLHRLTRVCIHEPRVASDAGDYVFTFFISETRTCYVAKEALYSNIDANCHLTDTGMHQWCVPITVAGINICMVD